MEFRKAIFNKYLFIFEYDQKLIHLLRLKQSANKKDNKKIIATIKIITIIILFIVLGSLIFFGGNLLGKKYILYKKRKRKVANELEFEVFFDNNINWINKYLSNLFEYKWFIYLIFVNLNIFHLIFLSIINKL